MAKLIYTAMASLDGYIEDSGGKFDWAMPDEEVHTFINDIARPIGTYLYGRRMYETMAGWETDPSLAEHSAFMRDDAQIWQAAEKIVCSRTLEEGSTARTHIERDFEPGGIRERKSSAQRDLTIGAANLVAEAFRHGLVDECRLFLTPILVGGGKRALPDGVHLELELVDERRFGNGMVYLRYRARA